MALTAEQIAQLDQAYARNKSGQATDTNAGDVANIAYAEKNLGYKYDPTRNQSVTGAAGGQSSVQQTQPMIPADPTTGDVYKGLIPALTPEEQAAYNRQQTILNEDTAPVDEEAIRKKKLDEMQTEIDALNKVYAMKRHEAERAGLGRLGSAGAIQARRGLLGSDFGASQTAAQESANQDVYSAIDAEKNAKISNIMAAARGAAQSEIASKVEARRKGADSYVAFLKDAATRKTQRATDAIKNILAQNLQPKDSDLETIAKEIGISVGELKSQYMANKAENDKLVADKIAKKEVATAKKAADELKAKQEATKLSGKPTDKDLLDKGYTYIQTPAERDRLKGLGYEKYTQDGKTYMKPGKNVVKTVKVGSGKTSQTYQITYDQYGQELKREKIGGGAIPTSGGTKTSTKSTTTKVTTVKQTPEEKAFEKDLSNARKNLAQGKPWGAEWNYLKNQYGVPTDKLDAILNKDQYYNN